MYPPNSDNGVTPEGHQTRKVMPIDPNSQAVKDALKEGLQEWLDGIFSEFGKWTMRGIAAMVIAGFVYLALLANGWKHS